MSDVQITDTWQQRGAALAQSHRLQQFEIADWLLEGIELLGATAAYDFAESVFPQYARATFQSWVTVAKHFLSIYRIESDFLTFAHYQVAQGCMSDPWKSSCEKESLAGELVWLRQADEHKLSVSTFRDTITRAYELRHEAYFIQHSENRSPEPEPEQKPAPKPLKKDAFGNVIKEFKTPWLSERTRWCLNELARLRHLRPEQLFANILQDFIDAHSDEIGDTAAAAVKKHGHGETFALQVLTVLGHEEYLRECRERYQAEQKAKAELIERERAERAERTKVELELNRKKAFLMTALMNEWDIVLHDPGGDSGIPVQEVNIREVA